MRWRWWVAAALVPLAAGAQVYKWVDSQGRTQYGDRPPGESKSQSLKVEDTRGAVGLADADVEVLPTEFVWFGVAGRSTRELNASMRVNGPFNEIAESNVWGQTGWWIRWSPCVQQFIESCSWRFGRLYDHEHRQPGQLETYKGS